MRSLAIFFFLIINCMDNTYFKISHTYTIIHTGYYNIYLLIYFTLIIKIKINVSIKDIKINTISTVN